MTDIPTQAPSELKPCPFCGERADTFTHSGQGPTTYYVACMYCAAEASGGADAQKAIEVWNRRAPTQAPTDSAVEPAGVLGYVYSRANGGIFWSLRDPRPIPNTEYMAVKWCVPVVSQDELLAARQQLAEMRRALECATALHIDEAGREGPDLHPLRAHGWNPSKETGPMFVARLARNALASPSQPERGNPGTFSQFIQMPADEKAAVMESVMEKASAAQNRLLANCAQPERQETVQFPQGVKRIDDQRLREIMSGYADFPAPDYFETSSLAYEVRNWRMKASTFPPLTDDKGRAEVVEALREAAKAGAEAMRQLILLSQTMAAPYMGRHSDLVEIERFAALLDALAEGK